MGQKKKNFHRHFPTPGFSLYWLIFAYIIAGWTYPVVGLVALICMIGPVVTSIIKGRWWCGHVCPRGNMYDRRGQATGYLNPDCLKCGKCTLACPSKIMTLKH